MKKGFLAVLLLMLTISLTACGEATKTKPETKSPAQASPAATSSSTDMPDGFVLVKGGTFRMGSPAAEPWRGADETEHSVTVSDFYMSRFEVTQEEYRKVMGSHTGTFSGDKLPVENVSWFDAIAYCNSRSRAEGLTPVYAIDGQSVSWNRGANGYRLPTEAEWEYAARAGTTTPFNTETSISATEANYYGHYPYMIENNYFSQNKLDTKPGEYRQKTMPVGSFAPNKWGLSDIHGNVGEWCWDYYGEYVTQAQTDPTGPSSGTLRVSRGGGWNDFAKHLRSAYRSSAPPNNKSHGIGFRLARNVSATSETLVNIPAVASSTVIPPGKGKILVAYFSWGGNTRSIARQIQEQTGGDLFEIECVTPYSSDYNTVLDQAQRDQNNQARPALRTHVKDMSQYDTIILGYPNWWASIPMPIASFLEEYNFSGKTILPFCSHGGGRFGQSLSVIAKLAPQAKIAEGLGISSSGGSGLPNEISAWLSRNGIKKQ